MDVSTTLCIDRQTSTERDNRQENTANSGKRFRIQCRVTRLTFVEMKIHRISGVQDIADDVAVDIGQSKMTTLKEVG